MEQVEHVGMRLRSVRNLRGVELSEAAEALDVPERFLADLEDGRLHAFGPEVHAAAYLRVYGRYLGFDDRELFATTGPQASAAPWTAATPRRRPLVLTGLALVVAGAVLAVGIAAILDTGDDQAPSTVATDDAGADAGDRDVSLADETAVESRSLERAPATDEPSDDDAQSGDEAPADEAPSDGDPAAASPGEGLTVQVLDGAGDQRRVQEVRAALEALGFEVVFVDRAAGTYERTTVLHSADLAEAVAALQAADDRFTATAPDPGLGAPADLHVVVGRDWPRD